MCYNSLANEIIVFYIYFRKAIVIQMKNIFPHYKKLNLKQKIIFYFASVALIPLVIFLIMMTYNTVCIFTQSQQYNNHVQNQIALNIYDSMTDTKQVVSTFHNFETLGAISNFTSIDSFYSNKQVGDIVDQIKTCENYSTSIKDVFLYFHSADVILSKQGILTAQDYYIINSDNIAHPYDEWLEILQNNLEQDAYIPERGQNSSHIKYVCNLSRSPYYKNLSDNLFTLVMSIPTENFFRGAESIPWLFFGDTYVFDESGKFLFGRLAEASPLPQQLTLKKLHGRISWKEKEITTKIDLPTTTWTVTSVTNRFEAYKSSLYQFMITMLTLLLCVFLIIFAISYFSKKSFSPFHQLYTIVGDDYSNITEFDSLINSVKQIMLQNKYYTNEISTQKRKFQRIILNNLLNGNLSSTLLYTISDYDIDFPHNNFLVIALSIHNEKTNLKFTQQDMLSNMIQKFLAEELSSNNILCYTTYENNSVYSILNIPDNHLFDTLEMISQPLHSFLDSLYIDLDIFLDAGISSIHYSYSEISAAYMESLEALSSAIKTHSKLMIYEDISQKEKNYLTVKQENDIINFLQVGNFENVLKTLKDIFNNLNFIDKNYQEPFLYDLICMYAKLPYILDLSNDPALIKNLAFPLLFARLKSPEDLYAYIIGISQKICEHISVQKESYHFAFAERIAEYISSNYSNQNLTTDSICEHMNCSKSYISKLFKNEYNLSIYEYIQKTRIEKAKELLMGKIPINQIYINVGFSNQRTFNRTFKNYENMSPSEYKKVHHS